MMTLGQTLKCMVFNFLMLVTMTAVSAADDAATGRGKYLFEAAGCGSCHGGEDGTSVPAGGIDLTTPFGRFYAPNITPNKTHGIGNWTEADFRAALRHGIGPDGRYLFPVFPFTSFTNLNDADIADLYAYLMSLPSSPKPSKVHEATPPFGWRSLLLFWRTLFFSEGPIRADASQSAEWNRGNYLVHAVAHCEECHTPRNFLGALKSSRAFAGTIGGPDGQNAPNITSDTETGIGSWSVNDIEHLLKTGETPDYEQVSSGMKAVVRGTSKLTDADRHAIAVYLKTLPSIRAEHPAARSPS